MLKRAAASSATLVLLVACSTTPPPARSAAAPGASSSTPVTVKGRLLASELKTNAAGIDIIKKAEGLQLKSYELGGGEFIGYGHLMKQGEPDTINEAAAEKYLREDLAPCEQVLGKTVTQPISPNEFSAMVSLCYNIGTGNMKSSSVVRLLNEGDRAGAADAMLLWNKANGAVLSHLADRRKLERSLFLKP
jgi:GH24 family phage-related lysozyme (muramidase)